MYYKCSFYRCYLLVATAKMNKRQLLLIQGAKTELFAVGTTFITRTTAKPYLFTLENIKSFNVQTREIVFQDFEPTSQLFPIYRNIEVHSYGKVLLHITTFVSSLNSQIFTDLSLVSESGKFYLSDCYPRNIENDSHYAKDNKAIAESREKRATEWGEFLSILRNMEVDRIVNNANISI